MIRTIDNFDLNSMLSALDERLMGSSEGRVEACRYSPLLFMLTYISHSMQSEETSNEFSVNDLNLLLTDHALEWAKPRNVPKRNRRAYLAPRGASKTTTLKSCILWSLAYGHNPYILVLSGSSSQAEKFLQSIRNEMDRNALLRMDFPDLCTPAKKDTGFNVADTKNTYMSKSMSTIECRSISSSVLGALVNDMRPQLLVLDDISRGEGVGSVYQAQQRLEVVIGTVLPLNVNAPVVFTCTNHFVGSLEDDLVKSVGGEAAQWVKDEKFEVFWLHPIVSREDGSLRSIWPERWSLEYLLAERHTRSYKRDMENLPVPLTEGDWFSEELFVVDDIEPVSSVVVSVDPGISQNGDATGLSVVGFSQTHRKAIVFEAIPVHLRSVALKSKIVQLIEQYPGVKAIVWEASQGGENLAVATLGEDFPLPIHFYYPKKSKLERAELLLHRYYKKQVVHARELPAYTAEALSLPKYPKSPNLVDSVGQAVEHLGYRRKSTSLSVSKRSIPL